MPPILSVNDPVVNPLPPRSLTAKPKKFSTVVLTLLLFFCLLEECPFRNGNLGLFSPAAVRFSRHPWNFAEKGIRGFI